MTQKEANNLFLNHLMHEEGGKRQLQRSEALQFLEIANRMLLGTVYPAVKLWAVGKERIERKKL